MIRRILLFRWLTILFMLLHSFADLPAARGSARSSPATPTAGHHVAFWPLDEPAGTAVAGDLTGNGHYGTLSAGVTAGAAGAPTGDGDTAMAFHGADQVTVASMAGLPSGAHSSSLEAWVDMAGGGAANEGLVGYGNYGSTRQADLLRTNGWAGLFTSWWNDDLWANGSATLIGGWHLAVATYDGHARRLYLDGAPFAADAPANQPNVQLLNLALGQTGGGDYLTGSLANVAIYPYALSPARIARHYALGQHSPAPVPTTSVLQYSYDGAGRLNSIVYPDGGRENHSDYDPAGRVTHISLPDYTDYYLSYNGAGQRTQLAFPNGGKEYWAYDPAGRPHDTWWAGPGGTVPFTQTATLDAAGQRTVLQDTAGSTTYGYDGAGRLTAASYPGGSTEADQYDPLGDRTVITSTTVLSGTAVTTNSFDAAAQLQTSAVMGGQPGTTTYTYDGNGNQTGSAGPAGTVANTFNQQGQLTHVSGPSTNETFVYDGQGDRLRAYDQSTSNYQLHTLVQDLRPGGMSGLLSDGAADYGYADFGVGAAPVARMDAGSSQGAYLASDLLGSVRLATNPADQVLGSGGYDAWGTAKPVTADAAGQVLLAGLQASAPFGYAGQQYDAGPGTYSMRARQYDPAQGRFQSGDPQAPSQGYPVTLNPYQYAGDMVTGTTDPSGRGWVYQQPRSADYVEEAAIAYDTLPGTSFGFVGGGPFLEFHVPVSPDGVHCGRGSSIYTINVLQRSTGEIWDIEHVQAYRRSASSIRTGVDGHLIGGARTFGVLNQTYAGIPGMPGHGCTRFDEMGCRDPSAAGPQRLSNAHGGERYPQAFGLLPSHLGGASGADVRVIPIVARQEVLAAWQADSGVIVYDTFPAHFPEQRLCPANYNAKQCLFDILVVQDVNTATNTHANLLARGLAVFNISTNLMLGAGLVIKGIRLATKAATATGDLLARLSAGTALVAIQDAGGSVRLATDIEEASLARAAERQSLLHSDDPAEALRPVSELSALDDKLAQQGVDILKEFLQPSLKQWYIGLVTQQEAILGGVEKAFAQAEGRLPAAVKARYLGDTSIRGSYAGDGLTGEILVNSKGLSKFNLDTWIGTIAHEGRHAYQKWAVHRLEELRPYPDVEIPVGGWPSELPDVHIVENWEHNLKPENYKIPPDPELKASSPEYISQYNKYVGQTVEQDAEAFGRRVRDKVRAANILPTDPGPSPM